MPLLSIITPTLNEAHNLPVLVRNTRDAGGAGIEWVVGDCDSVDGTPGVARSLGLRVVRHCRFRSGAMNAAAAQTAGDVLLFLHADTRLPHDFPSLIRSALARPGVVGGAFDFTFAGHPRNRGLNRRILQAVVLVNRVRFRTTRLFYGDQAIFVRRDVFRRLGGFPPVRLLEDAAFCRRMRDVGRTVLLSPPVRTSPRRFVDNGPLRQIGRDLSILAADAIGVRADRLHGAYNCVNGPADPHRLSARRNEARP